MTSLPKSMRIVSSSEIREALSEGRRTREKGLSMYVRKNNTDSARFVACVPKSVFRSAVTRNRYKRVLRAGFDEQVNKSSLKCLGLDILVLLKKPLAETECLQAFIKLKKKGLQELGS